MTESARLLALAKELVESCPGELGSEIAVTGSVGAGLADEHSDIELLFLGRTVPGEDRVRGWLDNVDGVDGVRAGSEESGVWGWCLFRGVEIDPFWRALDEVGPEVAAITRGNVLEHRRLAFAHVLLHSVVLRTEGALPALAARCRQYPEGLGRRLIDDALAGWELPATRIGAPVRRDALEARAWLQHDAERVLRIVFALNERWEPPRWKWVRAYAEDLAIRPQALVDRVELAVLSDDLVGASRSIWELALEALRLLPAEIDARRSEHGLQVRLAALDRAIVALGATK